MICSLLLRLLLQETKQKPSKSPSLLLLLLLFFFSSPTHRQQWNNHSCSLERKPASLSIWCHAALRLSKSMTNYQPTNLPIIRTWNSNAFLLQCLLPVCLPSLPPSLPPSRKYTTYEKRKNWRHNSSLLFLVSYYISMRNSNTNRIFPQKSNQTNKQTNNHQKTKRTKTRTRSNTKRKQEIPPSPRTRLFFRWPWYIGKNDKFQIKSVKKLSAFWDFQ